MALIPGWNATCLRLGPPSDEPLEPLDADGCVLRGVTELWCNRTHYDAEVTSTSDPPAALMTIINTRRRTCAGAYVERLRLFGAPTYASGASFRSAAAGDAMTGAAHAHAIHLFEVERDRTGKVLPAVAEAFKALMLRERVSVASLAVFDSTFVTSAPSTRKSVAASRATSCSSSRRSSSSAWW